MSRFAHVTVVILLAALPALAEPYQVAYEGDVFPEEDGWQRFTDGGGVDRSIENGVLMLSSDDPSQADQYLLDLNGELDAGPGEMFYAEWRMRVLPGSGSSDVTLFIGTDGAAGDVLMGWSPIHFWSFNDFNNFPLDCTFFRTYRIQSFNMIDYDFFIDGEYAYSGFFDAPGIADSWFLFGDGFVGTQSSSAWDYVRFGAVRLGNLDNNTTVNLSDFATFAICFGVPVSSPPPGCSDAQAHASDFNGDAMIDLNDFATFAGNFGAGPAREVLR